MHPGEDCAAEVQRVWARLPAQSGEIPEEDLDSGTMTQLRVAVLGRYVGSHIRRPHIYLAAILFWHIGYTAFYEVRFENNFPDGDMSKVPGDTTYLVPLLIFLYLWCKTDTKDRHIDLPFLPSVLVPLLFPIGVPYYFVRTYGLRRGLLHIGLAVIFAALCLAVAKITYMVYFYLLIVAH
jgi:hypothetical protein